MPLFSTSARPKSLSSSIAALLGGGGISPLEEMQATSLAAQTAHQLATADKLRAEVDAERESRAMRTNPDMQHQFAGNVAALDSPTAAMLRRHLSGAMDQPGPADIQDAELNQSVAQPFRAPMPNIEPSQRDRYQSAIASILASNLGTGKSQADDILRGVTENLKGTATGRALDAAARGDVGAVNRYAAGVRDGKELTPFKLGTEGQVLDEYTGKLNEDTAIADSHIARRFNQDVESRSRARAADALIGLREAQAGAADSLGDLRNRTPGAGRGRTITPEQVQRYISLDTQNEFKAEMAAWEKLRPAQRKTTPQPTIDSVRARVAERYRANPAAATSRPSDRALSEYPDARFDSKSGKWVVTRDGKTYAIVED